MTFTESGYDAEGYNLTINGKATSIENADKASAKVEKEGQTASAAFENAYAQKLGSVKVTKAFSGIEGLPEGFQITNSFNDTVFTVGNKTSGTGKANDPYTWVIENVPVGTTVTFTESGYDAEGYKLTINGKATSEKDATKAAAKVTTEGEAAAAAFVNAYSQKVGSVQVTKAFSGLEKLPKDFQITNSFNEEVFKVKDASGTGTAEDPYKWTIENVPVGTPVTFTESGYDAEGYNLTINGTASAEADKTVTATAEEGKTVSAGFTNEYSQKVGSVQVTKAFSGLEKLPKDFQITNSFNKEVFTVDNASGKGTADDPYTWTIENVPVGIEIIFTESGYEETGYEVKINQKVTTDADAGIVKATVVENEIASVAFTNEYTPKEREIEISKVDLTNNTELEGASLQITGTDIDGKEITPIKWKSGDDGKNENGTVKTHTVKLTAGTYTLSETAAPDGYKIAEIIKFTIDKEGNVTSETKDAVTGNKVTMKDEKKDTSASISVTKNLKTVAGENIYAVDQTFYVALYEDENCTKLASEIKALTFKNSTSETVTFEGVEPNKTYYVGECTKDGVRYLSGVVAGTKYVAQFTDGNSVTVETPNGSKAVYFDNRFMKFPDGFYKEGVLSITKLFKDKTGKAKNSDETFYAGIFDDEECTKLSENVAQNIIPLNLNGSSSVTAQIKVSIAQGTSKTFYVTEVDKDGKPINEETFKYDVSVENGEVTFDENNTSAEVTITNQEQDEDKDKDKDKDKGKTTTTSSNATSTKAVKTGDNTPIGIFVILLIAAIVVIGGGIYLKRRKK